MKKVKPCGVGLHFLSERKGESCSSVWLSFQQELTCCNDIHAYQHFGGWQVVYCHANGTDGCSIWEPEIGVTNGCHFCSSHSVHPHLSNDLQSERCSDK